MTSLSAAILVATCTATFGLHSSSSATISYSYFAFASALRSLTARSAELRPPMPLAETPPVSGPIKPTLTLSFASTSAAPSVKHTAAIPAATSLPDLVMSSSVAFMAILHRLVRTIVARCGPRGKGNNLVRECPPKTPCSHVADRWHADCAVVRAPLDAGSGRARAPAPRQHPTQVEPFGVFGLSVSAPRRAIELALRNVTSQLLTLVAQECPVSG